MKNCLFIWRETLETIVFKNIWEKIFLDFLFKAHLFWHWCQILKTCLSVLEFLEMNLQVTGSSRVPGRTFGWKVKVRVWAVEEGFPPLAVGKVGLQDQTRAWTGLRVQGAATHWQSIFHIKTTKKKRDRENQGIRKIWYFLFLTKTLTFSEDKFKMEQLAERDVWTKENNIIEIVYI